MSYYAPPPESSANDLAFDLARRRQTYSGELAEYSRRALLSAHGQYLQAERERAMMYRAQGYDYPLPPELNLPPANGPSSNVAQSPTPPPSLQPTSSSSSSASPAPLSLSYPDSGRTSSFASPPPPPVPSSSGAGGRTTSTELATTFDRMRVADDRSRRRRSSARATTTTMPTEAERLVRHHMHAPTTVQIEEATSDLVAPRASARRQSSRIRKPGINA